MKQKTTKESFTKDSTLFDIWDGSIADGFAGGSGSAEDPYLISSASQLAYLRNMFNKSTLFSNKVYQLTNDIDLNGIEWTSIGLSGISRGILFDGKNHIIRGLSARLGGNYQGLFGSITLSSSIINLTVLDGFVAGNSYVGGIVGRFNGQLKNCHFSGLIQGSSYYIGGIVGYLTNGSVTDCSNAAAIPYTSNALENNRGGIVGYVSSSNMINITNCVNNGDIFGTTSIGGITSNGQKVIINNCINNGTICGTDGQIGGIVAKNGTVEGCMNTGTVISGGSDSGGIAGTSSNVSHCLNTGLIEGAFRCAGIIGNSSTGVGEVLIENCYNTGTIKSNSTITGTGGIIAHNTSKGLQMKNCYNGGVILNNSNYHGALLANGSSSSKAQIINSHYLLGSAMKGIGKVNDVDYLDEVITFVDTSVVVKNVKSTEAKLSAELGLLKDNRTGTSNIKRILKELDRIRNLLSLNEVNTINPSYHAMMDNLMTNTTLDLKYDKKRTLVSIGLRMLYKNYHPAFVAGLLANIAHEGQLGFFESSNYDGNLAAYPLYLQYMDNLYNYRTEYSYQNIMTKKLSQVDVLLKKLERDNYQKGKFGLGSVQWTGDRTRKIVDLYMSLSGGDYISYNEVIEAEVQLILNELNGIYRNLYSGWESRNAGNLDSEEAARDAGTEICREYEKPKDDTSKKRGEYAVTVYNIMLAN